MKENLNQELKEFWIWADSNIEEHKNQGWHKEQEPFEYPQWEYMIGAAKAKISEHKKNTQKNEVIYDLLTIMALDNESEEIMDFMEETMTDTEIERVISVGLQHELMDARWQIAELIGRKNLNSGHQNLELLLEDSNAYVARRALLSIHRTDPSRAEEFAYQRVVNEDEYIRLVSLRILIECNSKYIGEAIKILKNDPFEYIQLEIERYLK